VIIVTYIIIVFTVDINTLSANEKRRTGDATKPVTNNNIIIILDAHNTRTIIPNL